VTTEKADDLSLAGFLDRYRASVTQAVLEAYPPVYTAANRTDWGFDLSPLKRRPKGAQADAIRAAAVSLARQRGTNVVGEMGTGKTFVAAAAAYLAGCKRVLVLCPPHLVRKWCREIEHTVPGAEAVICKTVADVRLAYRDRRRYPGLLQFVVLSRESAKLGLTWRPVYRARKDGDPLRCCACGADLYGVVNKGRGSAEEVVPLTPGDLSVKKRYCEAERVDRHAPKSRWTDGKPPTRVCGAPLWGSTARLQRGGFAWTPGTPPVWPAQGSGPRRIALADYIARRMPGAFDLLVSDEVHEYKARESAQGIAAGQLAEATKRTLTLTGTLFGGYASTLFYLLWRFTGAIREEFGIDEVSRWVSTYGIVEKVTKYSDEEVAGAVGRMTRRKRGKTTTRERPGVTPALLLYLLPNSAFVRLADVAADLPPVTDEVALVEMDDRPQPDRDATRAPAETTQARAYAKLEQDVRAEARRLLALGSKRLLGAMLQSLLAYPDACYRREEVRDPKTHAVVATAPALRDDWVYPKEALLLRTADAERAQSRNVLVYVTHTESRDVTPRLHRLLEARGHRVAVLKRDPGPAAARAAWVQKHVKAGFNVLLCHPRLVQTGLDLVDFPTIFWFEPDYSVYTLRQASRRSWRIGQTRPVRVIYAMYAGTLQTLALQLIAQKTRASLLVEGELASGGLLDQAGEEDVQYALARKLVEGEAGGEESLEALFAEARAAETEVEGVLATDAAVAEDVTPDTPAQAAVLAAALLERPPAPERAAEELDFGDPLEATPEEAAAAQAAWAAVLRPPAPDPPVAAAATAPAPEPTPAPVVRTAALDQWALWARERGHDIEALRRKGKRGRGR
jgi:hypothetical protein